MIRKLYCTALALLLSLGLAHGQGTFPGQGVTESTVATSLALGSVLLNSNTTVMRVSSVTAGGGCPMTFTKGTATPTGVLGEVLNAPSGIYWEPVYSNSPVRACQFTAIGDGTWNYFTGAVTGTDNAPRIQGALDYAMQNGFTVVCLNDAPQGYRTDDTLHLGWGNTFYHIELVNCAGGRGGFNGAPGPVLFPTKTDRCAINIQGGRLSRVAGVSIVGQNVSWADFVVAHMNQQTGYPSLTASGSGTTATITYTAGIPPSPGSFDYPIAVGSRVYIAGITPSGYNGIYTVTASAPGSVSFASATTGAQTVAGTVMPYGVPSQPASWLNPTLAKTGTNPGGIQQHSPYAGLCIDAFSMPSGGSPPADAYPAKTYPAWTGLSAGNQYLVNVDSSDIEVAYSNILGFGVGVIQKPSGTSNGDFTRIHNNEIADVAYSIAIDNTQSRNVEIRNNSFSSQHTFLTNNTFGEQLGTLGGPIENNSGGEGYQLYAINVANAQIFRSSFMYAEGQAIIGTFVGASNASSVFLEDHQIASTSCVSGDNYPSLIEAETNVSIEISDLIVGCVPRSIMLAHSTGPFFLKWSGGGFIANGSAPVATWADANGGVQAAFNYTGGMLMGPALNTSYFGSLTLGRLTWGANINAGFMSGAQVQPQYTQRYAADVPSGIVAQPLLQVTDRYADLSSGTTWRVTPPVPLTFTSITSVSNAAPTYTACGQVVFNYLASNQDGGSPMAIGHLLYLQRYATYFAVTNIAAKVTGPPDFYPVTMLQMNNVALDKSTEVCIASNLTLTQLQDNTSQALIFPTAIAIPPNIAFGNCTSGSTAVSSVAPIGAQTMLAGAPFYWNTADAYLNSFFAQGTKLNAIGAGAATLSANALATGRCPLFPLQIR